MKLALTINFKKIAMYFVLISALLNGSVMWRYLSETVLTYIVLIVLLYLSCLIGILFLHRNISKKSIEISFCILVFFAVYMIGTRYQIITFLIYYVIVFVMLFIYIYELFRHNEINEFIESFIKIIVIFAALSLFFWFFGSILNIIPGRTQLDYEWANRTYITYTYYGLYFENPVQSEQILFGVPFIRNSGVYAEVPGYSGVLLYAITIELLKEKRSKWRIAILLATLISTFSTKGFIVFIVIIVVNYLTKPVEQKRSYQIMKFTASSLLVIGGIFVCTFILQDKSQTGSYTVRMDDIRAAMEAWLSSPLFGVGYNNLSSVAKYFQLTRSSDGLSMGLTALLAQGGLWLMSFYIGAFICAFRCDRLSKYRHEICMFSLMVLINLFVSNSGFSTLMLITLACGYSALASRETGKFISLRSQR